MNGGVQTLWNGIVLEQMVEAVRISVKVYNE